MSRATLQPARSPGTNRRRVLAVYRPGAGGEAVLSEARELAAAGMTITFVTLVPYVKPVGCCRPAAYNVAMREEAARELARAQLALDGGAGATFIALSERDDPPLPEWVRGRQFDMILLPGSRYSLYARRLRRQLRSRTSAEIRLRRRRSSP